MIKGYLGIDIGSISTKGVIIDKNNKILAKAYLWTKGNPINAVKEVLTELKKQIKDKNIKIVSVGTTGSARKLIGTILNASIIKNEIIINTAAHMHATALKAIKKAFLILLAEKYRLIRS